MKKFILFASLAICTYQLNAQQCNGNLPVSDNFDTNEIGVCWQITDMDGDNNNWLWFEYSPYLGGYKVIASYSVSTQSGALTPDNWIISYPIDLRSFSSNTNIQLSYEIRASVSYVAHEYYTVYAATGNQISDFQSSPVKQGEYTDAIGARGTFVTRTLDVSSFAGNIIYVAFRHHNSTNQSNIEIDEVSISSGSLGIEDFNKENFKFYYSPNSQTLSIRSANNPISAVEIFNLLGQNVVSKSPSTNNEDINLSSLTDGIYIARIEIDNTVKSIKFLKQ